MLLPYGQFSFLIAPHLTRRYQSHPFSPVSLDQLTQRYLFEIWWFGPLERGVEIGIVGDLKATNRWRMNLRWANAAKINEKRSNTAQTRGGRSELWVGTNWTNARVATNSRSRRGVQTKTRAYLLSISIAVPDNQASFWQFGLSIAKEVAEQQWCENFTFKDNEAHDWSWKSSF